MSRFVLRSVLVCLTGLFVGMARGNDTGSGQLISGDSTSGSNYSQSPLAPKLSGFFESVRYQVLIDEVASSHGIDKHLLHAIVSVESRYNPSARSPSGATGLMQLMPTTARRYGVINPLDPEQNLRGGARYFSDLLNTFGNDVLLALAAYHAGEYAVARHQNRIPPFRATISFVSKVMERYYKQRSH